MKLRTHSSGQALVMVTLSLFAMTGMMGLAVDLGWSFFVQKQAQAAADGAALAAVHEVYERKGGTVSTLSCGSGATEANCVSTPTACTSIAQDSNLYNGCIYAAQNGFTAGGASSQNVTMQASVPSTLAVPVSGVNNVAYWVTARTAQTIPQLFSSVLGNTQGTVSAQATAAIVAQVVPGSLYGLNREGDCMGGTTNCGVDFNIGGNGTIIAPDGIVLASSCNGTAATGCTNGNKNTYAGTTSNGATITGPRTYVRTAASGGVDVLNSPSQWPAESTASSAMFLDPTRGKTQPPLQSSGQQPYCLVSGGVINGSTYATVGPYNYLAYSGTSSGKYVLSGAPITTSGDVTFSSSSNVCPGITLTGGTLTTGSFQAFYFHGGLNPGTSNSTVNFGAGQYVVDGLCPTCAGSPNNATDALTFANTMLGNSTAGTMFIVTAPGYSGGSTTLDTQLSTSMSAPAQIDPASWSTLINGLVQGDTTIQAGNNSNVDLTGLQKSSIPANLVDYSGIVVWADRRNSTVKYNADGTFNCASPYTTGCTKTSSELTADKVTSTSSHLILQAHPNLHLKGVLYNPRGSYATLQGNGGINSALQIVAGAFDLGGGPSVTLTAPTDPLITYKTALIQ